MLRKIALKIREIISSAGYDSYPCAVSLYKSLYFLTQNAQMIFFD